MNVPNADAAAAVHPNWMTNAETVVSPAMNAMMKGALQGARLEGPLLEAFAARVRGSPIASACASAGSSSTPPTLRKVTDVRHYRG